MLCIVFVGWERKKEKEKKVKNWKNNLHAEGFEPSSANTSRPKRDPLDLSGKHANKIWFSIGFINNTFFWKIVIMSLTVGSKIPLFKGHSQKGRVEFETDGKDKFSLVFSYISDFSPICATVYWKCLLRVGISRMC